MSRVSLLVAGVILALALVPCACGSRDARPATEDAGTSEVPRRPWGEPRHRDAFPLNLPGVRNARWSRPEENPFVVSLPAGGDLYFAGKIWGLRTATEGERRTRFDALRSELARRSERGSDQAASPEHPSSLRVRADRWLRWVSVRDVLQVALEEPLRIQRILLAVRSRSTFRRVEIEAAVSRSTHGDPPATGARLPIELSGRFVDAETAEVRLAVGGEAWTVTYDQRPGHEFLASDQGRAGMGIGDMADARAHLGTMAPGYETVVLRLPRKGREVLWGQVVGVLDMILGAGLREVDLPQLDVRVSLAGPQDLGADPFVHAEDPVVTPLTLVLCLLALAAVFALTLSPLRGLRDGPSRR